MANQLLVGSQSVSDGAFIYPRGGKQGNAFADKLHGDMYEQAYKGALFHVTNQATVITTVGLTTTWTGLAIANPATSGVNLVIRTVGVSQSVAATTASAIGVMCGTGAAAGALVVRNAKVGGAASATTTASAGASIATPVLERIIGSVGTGAVTVPLLLPQIVYDFQGSLIIPPGYYMASFTTGVCSLTFSYVWEEVPV